TPPPTPSNIKSLSFSSPRCGGIEGGARRGLNMYLIRAETPVKICKLPVIIVKIICIEQELW
ncbi:MAG: hypothetical protein ACKPES_27820, partial [Dolichospermum sp.]